MKGHLSQVVMCAINKVLEYGKKLYKLIKTDNRKEARLEHTIYKRNPNETSESQTF